MSELDMVVNILAMGVPLSVPILLASIGEAVSERAGVLNICIEGYMLMGSIAAYLVAYYVGNIYLAVVIAILASIAVALLHGYGTINLGCSQLLSGIGINILVAGIAVVLYREMIFKYATIPPKVVMFENINIPALSDIPVVGPILFRQNPLFYLGVVLSVLLWYFIKYTYLGLMIRAVGEDPLTVDTSGFSPVIARYMGLIIGSATAGLGGAYLVLGYLGWFAPGITGGKGFIALAIVIAANWNPIVCLLVSYLFGAIDAIQLRFQVGGYEMIAPFLMAVPYAFTIVILVLRRKVFVPKALAKPYVREEE